MREDLESVLRNALEIKGKLLLIEPKDLMSWARKNEPKAKLRKEEAICLIENCYVDDNALALGMDDGELYVVKYEPLKGTDDSEEDPIFWKYVSAKITSSCPVTLQGACTAALRLCRTGISSYTAQADQAMSDEEFDEANHFLWELEEDKKKLDALLKRLKALR